MTSKAQECVRSRKAGEQSTGTIVPLVRRERSERPKPKAKPPAAEDDVRVTTWNGDDDPGPTAA